MDLHLHRVHFLVAGYGQSLHLPNQSYPQTATWSSHRTSQVVFQGFPAPFCGVFHDSPGPCTVCRSASFITLSTLSSRPIVRDMLAALNMAIKCQFPQICHTSHSHFHGLPGLENLSLHFSGHFPGEPGLAGVY